MFFLATLLTLTIKVGVYHTIPQDTVLLHNRSGEVTTEKVKGGRSINLDIKNMLAETAEMINDKAFSGQKLIKFETAFIRPTNLSYGDAEILPSRIVKLKTGDQLLPALLEQFSCPENIDICLMVSDKRLRASYVGKDGMLVFQYIGGVTDELKKILIFDFPHRNLGENTLFLAHELGHILKQGHKNDKYCKSVNDIMCPSLKNQAVTFGDEYKKAWRDFYQARTGQRFEPRR